MHLIKIVHVGLVPLCFQEPSTVQSGSVNVFRDTIADNRDRTEFVHAGTQYAEDNNTRDNENVSESAVRDHTDCLLV